MLRLVRNKQEIKMSKEDEKNGCYIITIEDEEGTVFFLFNKYKQCIDSLRNF